MRMRMRMRMRILKWLYPGMGVKRWAALATLSLLALIFGVLGLVGKELVKQVYAVFSASAIGSYSLAALFIVAGIAGVVASVNGTIRSIVRGIAAGAEGRMAEIIYSKRLLSKGPRIVALGGGTGLSTLLRGLKEFTANITAVVTVMDDGGSSGRLREELSILPPGDIRNCIIALAEDESKMAQLFQHRFGNSSGSLNGHSLGNLVIAGLKEITGSFDRAIEETSLILNIRGQVLPATLEDVTLVAEMEDGQLVRGECNIAADPRRIKRMMLSKTRVAPYEKVLEQIRRADIIVLGPGSLFTSLIPNLLVEGIAKEIEEAPATKFYVANLMTQPGETDNFTLSDHLKALKEYIDISTFDFVILNEEEIPPSLIKRYQAEGSRPVVNDLKEVNEFGLHVLPAKLLDTIELGGKLTVKHNSKKLAKVITERAKKRSAAEKEV